MLACKVVLHGHKLTLKVNFGAEHEAGKASNIGEPEAACRPVPWMPAVLMVVAAQHGACPLVPLLCKASSLDCIARHEEPCSSARLGDSNTYSAVCISIRST